MSVVVTNASQHEQGVPKGYVEHSRALSDHGRCVRKAYISGDLEKRPRKARYALTPSQEVEQTKMIFSALDANLCR